MAKSGLGRGLDAVIPKKYSQKTSERRERSTSQEDSLDLDDLDLDDPDPEEQPAAKKRKAAAGAASTKGKKSSVKTAGKSSSEAAPAASSKSGSQETPEVSPSGAVDDTLLSGEDSDNTVDSGSTALQETAAEKSSGVLMLRISEVEPNRDQPRKMFNEDSLTELAESVKQYGIIQPLLVQKREDYYEIIAGERRWRAARMAGLKEVPVIVRDYTDREILEVSLIENIQREDLNPIEEAKAYQRLIQDFELKQDEVAERVSKSRTAITNSMRLLKLDPRVQQMLVDEMISAGHARAILSIEDPEVQYQTASRIFDEKMSVRETEKLVRTLNAPAKKKSTSLPESDALVYIYQEMEERMQSVLGTKVSVHRKTPQKGRIEIEYYSRDELERIYELLRSMGNV